MKNVIKLEHEKDEQKEFLVNKKVELSLKLANNTVLQILGLDNFIFSSNFSQLVDCLGEKRKISSDDYEHKEAA